MYNCSYNYVKYRSAVKKRFLEDMNKVQSFND
jgi:hypothetical protein